MSNPEISEAAKAKALELTNAQMGRWGKDQPGRFTLEDADPENGMSAIVALARRIQTTSDVAKEVLKTCSPFDTHHFVKSLILPDPKDPLVEIMDSFLLGTETWQLAEAHAEKFLAELAKRGGKITFD